MKSGDESRRRHTRRLDGSEGREPHERTGLQFIGTIFCILSAPLSAWRTPRLWMWEAVRVCGVGGPRGAVSVGKVDLNLVQKIL